MAKKNAIVCFDLDHTLLDNSKNEICASAREAVSRLRESSYIVIASGRDMDNYYSYMFRDIVEPDAVIHQNGTRISVRDDTLPYDARKGAEQYRTIYEHFMEPGLVKAIIGYAEANGLCIGTTLCGKDYFVNPELKTKADKSYNKFLKRRYVSADDLWKLPVRALSYAGRDGAERKAFLKAFPGVRLLSFSSGEGADLVEKCCSKASGLERLCAYYDVPREHTYAFGDSENDIDILEAAGTGIAVGNAMEEVKQAADLVTDDIWHDGIYKACVKLGLF
ncbi:MAG: HAD family hydrolase [Eubacteriales bacterium]|nr:HAD family hydrolase [Eubacteriales bacterium]